MPRSLAYTVSILLHPLFMPLYTLFILFHSDSWISKTPVVHQNVSVFYVFALVIMVLMPALSIFILVRNKMVSDISVSKREERLGPYGITLFYYILFYILLKKIEPLPGQFLSVSLGSITVIAVVMVINFFMKISAHTAGLAGLAGLYTALASNLDLFPETWVLILIVLALGLAGTARLSITNHRPAEIYVGGIAGFTAEFLIVSNNISV